LRVLRGAPLGAAHTLAFQLPAAAQVKLELFDLAGRRIATLAQGELGMGAHVRTWDGRDPSGARVPRGLVFARLTAGPEVRSARVWIER
jgi:flagellar hook assembly protein FlgD